MQPIACRLVVAIAGAAVLALAAAPSPALAGTQPFIGEIMFHAGPGCPLGFAKASGQKLAIAEHGRLFSVLGTRFGGDGVIELRLPKIKGQVISVIKENGRTVREPLLACIALDGADVPTP
jgi:microcystin-dependent protein